MNYDQWVDIIRQGRIEWSAHALKRMLEKGISRASIKHIVCTGEMIENYSDDKPFPSGLFYSIWQNQPLHAVITYDLTNQKMFLITAYCPNEEHFETTLKTRKRECLQLKIFIHFAEDLKNRELQHLQWI